MRMIGPDEQITLDAIAEGILLYFDVGSSRYYLRIPRPEEVDAAENLMRATRRLVLAQAHIQALKNVPASAEDQALYEQLIEATTKRLEEAPAGSAIQERVAASLNALEKRMEERTAADELAEDAALLARDRQLTLLCLCDENGKNLFKPGLAESDNHWTALSRPVKDAARLHILRILGVLDEIPFDSSEPPTAAENMN